MVRKSTSKKQPSNKRKSSADISSDEDEEYQYGTDEDEEFEYDTDEDQVKKRKHSSKSKSKEHSSKKIKKGELSDIKFESIEHDLLLIQFVMKNYNNNRNLVQWGGQGHQKARLRWSTICKKLRREKRPFDCLDDGEYKLDTGKDEKHILVVKLKDKWLVDVKIVENQDAESLSSCQEDNSWYKILGKEDQRKITSYFWNFRENDVQIPWTCKKSLGQKLRTLVNTALPNDLSFTSFNLNQKFKPPSNKLWSKEEALKEMNSLVQTEYELNNPLEQDPLCDTRKEWSELFTTYRYFDLKFKSQFLGVDELLLGSSYWFFKEHFKVSREYDHYVTKPWNILKDGFIETFDSKANEQMMTCSPEIESAIDSLVDIELKYGFYNFLCRNIRAYLLENGINNYPKIGELYNCYKKSKLQKMIRLQICTQCHMSINIAHSSPLLNRFCSDCDKHLFVKRNLVAFKDNDKYYKRVDLCKKIADHFVTEKNLLQHYLDELGLVGVTEKDIRDVFILCNHHSHSMECNFRYCNVIMKCINFFILPNLYNEGVYGIDWFISDESYDKCVAQIRRAFHLLDRTHLTKNTCDCDLFYPTKGNSQEFKPNLDSKNYKELKDAENNMGIEYLSGIPMREVDMHLHHIEVLEDDNLQIYYKFVSSHTNMLLAGLASLSEVLNGDQDKVMKVIEWNFDRIREINLPFDCSFIPKIPVSHNAELQDGDEVPPEFFTMNWSKTRSDLKEEVEIEKENETMKVSCPRCLLTFPKRKLYRHFDTHTLLNRLHKITDEE